MRTHNSAGPSPRLACVVPALLLLAAAGRAEDRPRAAVARSTGETASLLRREAPGGPWRVVKEDEGLPAGGLLVGAPPGALVSANGAVRLTFLGDLSGTSPFPVLETAVALREPAGADLAFTFDRGRVDLTNLKKDGPARVRVHVRDRSPEIVLAEPGTRVAVEVYGRWPKGVPFVKDARSDHRPALAYVLLVLKGRAEVRGALGTLSLTAPPGPALVQGEEASGLKPEAQNLQALPPWAEPQDGTEAERRARAALASFRRLARAKGVGAALDELVRSDEAAARKLAVYLMGALDDLPRLGEAATNAKHRDVWETGVLALRHWIGRGPGQDQKLYQALIDRRGYTPSEAAGVLQLLHSFGDDDLARPETYEMLVDFLGSGRLALRGLAAWHLVRLVPGGEKIGYDPLAPKGERDRAAREWRKRIPVGSLPTNPSRESR